MQESGIDAKDAERHGASWYLSRDGQQHGPLTDRELSLFAEGGNFEPGDLLWTAGLDDWKPAEAVFGLASPGSGPEADTQAETTKTDADETAPGDASFIVEDEEPAEAGGAGAPEALETATGFEAMFSAPDAPEPDPSDRRDAGHLDAVHPDAGHPDTGQIDHSHLEAARLGAQHRDAVHLDDEHLDAGHLDAGHLDGHPPSGDHVDALHVDALAQAISGEQRPLAFKERIVAELKKFAGTGGYLWAVFVALGLHSWLGDAPYGPGLGFFLVMTINAFLALQLLGLAERLPALRDLEHQPLIYTIAYKTIGFGTLLFGLYILELMVFGFFGGAGLGLIESLGGVFGMVALWIILTVAMAPYFAFRALQRAVGSDVMRKLLFVRR